MTIESVRHMLLWCSVFNLGILLWWFLLIVFAHDWVYRLHTKWFKISVERFDGIHYAGISFFKIMILFFNVVPYAAFRLAG